MPSLVIAQVGQMTMRLFILQLIHAAFSEIAQRESFCCSEDDRGSFQPTGWWAKFLVFQIPRAKFIECLGCTVITWVCRGEIWQKERFSRTENSVSGLLVKPLIWVLFIIDFRNHVHGLYTTFSVVCRFICEQPRSSRKTVSNEVELMRPPRYAGTCVSGIRVWGRLSRRDVWELSGSSALISLEMKSVLALSIDDVRNLKS